VLEISIAEGKNPVGTTAANTNPITIAGVDGDNKIVGLVLNADGSITAKMGAGTAIIGKFIPVDADGDEKFTAANPASVQLTGGLPGGAVYPFGATKWTTIATSGANAIATATQVAVAGKKHYCMGYLVCLRAASAGNDFLSTIKDGTTVKFTDVVGNASPTGTRIGVSSSAPIVEGTANTDMVLSVGAAGANAITELTMWGYTI